jgi:uncharacterized protein (TIGR02391 family)
MDTTQILIPGDDAYLLVSDFSKFVAELNVFASICHSKGKTKAEYSLAFKSLKDSFSALVETRNVSAWVVQPVLELFTEISSTPIQGSIISGVNLEKIHNLVTDFLSDEISSESPSSFKHRFLENAISTSAKNFYSEELFDAISNQLEGSNYDDAVLVAFKFLDKHLRKLIANDSYELFGEELINKVFSPSSGMLQLNTHPNEQVGLRNWYSGANAIFRNPIAHRFGNMDDKSAFSVIAMVALMINTATKLAARKKRKKKSA